MNNLFSKLAAIGHGIGQLMSGKDLAFWQATISPFLTPAAPSLVFGGQVYKGLISSGIPGGLALFGASAGVIGMEFSGALMCSMAMRAILYNQRKPAIIAVLGAVFYAAFVLVGIMNTPNFGAFAGLTLVTLVAYVGSGLYLYLVQFAILKREGVIEDEKEREQIIKLKELELREKKIDLKLAQTGQTVRASTGQMDTPSSGLDGITEEGKIIRQWFIDNPGKSGRKCAKALKCSPTTANKWKPRQYV